MKKILFITLLLFFTKNVFACYYLQSGGYQQGPTTLTINMGNITTQTDAIGGTLATKEGLMSSFGGNPAPFSCGDGTYSKNVPATIELSGSSDMTPTATYPTNISGIGVRFYYYTTVPFENEPTTPTQLETTIGVILPWGQTYAYQNTHAAIKVELVKTGPVSGMQEGVLSFSRQNLMAASNGAATGTNLLNINITATITANTCNIDASTPSRVDMDTISGSDLPHKGSTIKDTPFTIMLICSGYTDVNLLLDGQEDTDSPGEGILSIKTGSQMASGVGIQLLFSNSPVELEKSFSVGTSTNGVFNIPMIARYYRTTEAPVKAGDVETSVVYSLTYR